MYIIFITNLIQQFVISGLESDVNIGPTAYRLSHKIYCEIIIKML